MTGRFQAKVVASSRDTGAQPNIYEPVAWKIRLDGSAAFSFTVLQLHVAAQMYLNNTVWALVYNSAKTMLHGARPHGQLPAEACCIKHHRRMIHN